MRHVGTNISIDLSLGQNHENVGQFFVQQHARQKLVEYLINAEIDIDIEYRGSVRHVGVSAACGDQCGMLGSVRHVRVNAAYSLKSTKK